MFRLPFCLFTLCCLLGGAVHAEEPGLTVRGLETALARGPSGAEAEALAEQIRALFGRDNLVRGALQTDELVAAWAIEAPALSAPPRVIAEDDDFVLPLARLGATDVYAAVAWLTEGRAFRWRIQSRERPFATGNVEVYRNHPDSIERPGVPKGKVTQMPPFESKIFAGTTRDWWIYVPAQAAPDRPCCVMVFQDGQNPRRYVPTVFDNLIASGEMPPTVGVFISPGTFKESGRTNRSVEYDTLSDRYARFLLEEVLPEVEKQVRLRKDAASRAISGISSGGICAFTVAWERPNEFSKVLSWVGSFTNIQHGATFREGGHNYPALIRKAPKRPIRVYLQGGARDLDNANGNWPLANQEMAKALAFAGYDYHFVYGQGFHSDRHGRALLPDSLRWLWRGYQPPE